VNINLTLVVQMLVFIVLIWFTMKYVWPMILGPMQEREKKIADGLSAANRGQKELDEAHLHAREILREAREKAAHMVDLAGKRSHEMVEEAKGTASAEAEALIVHAHGEITLETTRAREGLREEVGRIAIAGAAKLLQREIDPRTHAELLEKLAAEVARG
jgi:F-type H+-transporting ATPase subunit b